MSVKSFKIEISDAVLADLTTRLNNTRLAASPDAENWDAGTSPAYLRALCRYWAEDFDWRAQEAALNRFQHFRWEEHGLHFIHERGKGPDPIPLLLIHGWPDSFARYLKLIPFLTNPATHGMKDAPSFDVVIPDLPGFGFSDPPRKQGATFEAGDLLHKLMHDELGYHHYGAAGGDFGSMVAEFMARSHAAALIGIHLTDVPFFHSFQKIEHPSHAEQDYLKRMEAFSKKESAYALIQSTKPNTLAPALNDSPAGLAAWLIEKFRTWSDCDGDIERRFTRDELLTHVMIYWTTQTIGSSFAPYYDLANVSPLRWMSEGMKKMLGSDDVPAAFASFPKDLVPAPRDYAARFFNVQRWTEMPRGGHFAAWEEPELFARDLGETFAPLWRGAENRAARLG